VDEADDSLPVKAKAGGRASSVEIFCLDRQALVCLELASGLLVDTDVSLMGAAHARADGAVSKDHCTPALPFRPEALPAPGQMPHGRRLGSHWYSTTSLSVCLARRLRAATLTWAKNREPAGCGRSSHYIRWRPVSKSAQHAGLLFPSVPSRNGRCHRAAQRRESKEWTDMPPGSTEVLHVLHDPGDALWPASDVFTDDTFGRQEIADTRLCQRPSGAPGGDHVRLVRVSFVQPDGVMCCETCVTSLDPPEQYTAVSYTWGSSLLQRPLILDGRQHLVTEGLWRFLKHAVGLGKHFPGSGWLWIDALSIDQRSPRERAYQVGIMANIFWKAERVVVWLGPAYNDSGEAMKALSASVMQLQCVGAPPSAWTNLAESAFVGLCERPYWQRIWVFQELRAGRDIHLMCGNDIVPCGTVRTDLWRLFSQFLSNDDTGERLPRRGSAAEAVRCSPAWNMIRHVSLTNIDRVQTTLWTLLISTRNLQCADERDRVYALLNISTSGHQGISADYTMSIHRLLNRILRNWHSYLRPSSLHEVNRQCDLLEDMFSLSHNSMYVLSSRDTSEASFSPYRFRDFEWKQNNYEDAEIWAEFYGHTEVCRLRREAIETRDLVRKQIRDDVSAGQVSDSMTTVEPLSHKPQSQRVGRGSERGTVYVKACFSPFDRWTRKLGLRGKKGKHIQNDMS
jgi:hypothetical protein